MVECGLVTFKRLRAVSEYKVLVGEKVKSTLMKAELLGLGVSV